MLAISCMDQSLGYLKANIMVWSSLSPIPYHLAQQHTQKKRKLALGITMTTEGQGTAVIRLENL